MKRWSVLLAGLAFMFAVIPADEAEAQVWFGPQVVLWDFDELGIGGRLDFGLGDAFGIEDDFFEGLFASVDVSALVTADGDTPLFINGNVAVPFSVEATVTPYAGAGINILRVSGSSTSGLNLLGGVFFDLGDIPAFSQLQYSTSGAGFLTLSLGVLFGG